MSDFDRYTYEKCRNDPNWAYEEIMKLRRQVAKATQAVPNLGAMDASEQQAYFARNIRPVSHKFHESPENKQFGTLFSRPTGKLFND